jgi:hypothetical protein
MFGQASLAGLAEIAQVKQVKQQFNIKEFSMKTWKFFGIIQRYTGRDH